MARREDQGIASTIADSGRDLASDSTAVLTPSEVTAAAQVTSELPQVPTSAYQRGKALGAGGLGVVVEARDARLGRTVALKELRRESPASAARFVREALVTARLQHPGIVPIYEAGRWPGGAPFYAMKKVEGTSLAQAINARATLAERLALLPRLIAAADAIAYAHAQQVIHRDLKPHNIMIGEFGETLVIDWGLAKDLAAPSVTDEPSAESSPPSSDSQSEQTAAGAVLGTAGYMAPEQARGEAVSERVDVYALGAVLYQLLAGKAPPAGRLGEVPAPARLTEGPRDLIAIVEQAMAPDPADRYASAGALVEDLRRFQTGQLVSVREYGAAERFARLIRRHRGPAIIAALAIVALGVVGVISVRRVVAERDVARRARATEQATRLEAEQRRDALLHLQAKSLLGVDPTASIAWLEQLPEGRLDVASGTIAADALSRGVARHVVRVHDGSVRGLVVGPNGVATSAGADGTIQRIDLATGTAREVLRISEPVLSLAQAPGQDLVAAGLTAEIQLIERGTPRLLDRTASPVNAIAFSPDAKDVVGGLIDGTALLWRGGVGRPVTLGKATQEVRVVEWSPDGTAIAAASFDGTLTVWRARDGAVLLHGAHGPGGVWALSWSSDSRTIASAGDDHTARVWRLDGGAPLVLAHTAPVRAVAYQPDGRLATGGVDNAVHVWRPDGTEERALPQDGDVLRMAASPDGKTWATAGADKLVRLWDVGGAAPRVFRGHEEYVTFVGFTPDGGTLVSAGQDGSVRVWSTAQPGARIAQGILRSVEASGFLITESDDGVLRRVPFDGASTPFAPSDTVNQFDLAADGRLLGVGVDGALTVWDPTGRATQLPPAGFQLGHAAALGDVIVAAGWDSNLWRWQGAAPPTAIPGHTSYVLNVLAVPSQDRFVTGGADATMRIWDLQGHVLAVLAGFRGPVHNLAVSPDGALVAGGDINGVVMVWQIADGAQVARYEHRGYVRTLAWSPDSGRLASGGDDREVQVWTRGTGEARALDGHVQTISAVEFSHDGALLASGSVDGSVRLWNLDTGAQQLLRGHSGPVGRVAFAPADDTLLSVSTDGAMWRWPRQAFTPMPIDPGAQRAVLEGATSAVIGADDRPTSTP